MLAEKIADELKVAASQVKAALDLLDEGNTVPFIARYRKEASGGLDDTQLRQIEERATYLTELEERKQTVLAAIDEQGKLDDALRERIAAADTKARLEDIYRPYKKRRKTKADKAREAGLASLVDALINQPSEEPEKLAGDFLVKDYPTEKEALDGARAIFVDDLAMDADLVEDLRQKFYADGTMESRVVEGKEAAGEKFRDYFEFAEPFEKLPSHRILALLRGESEGVLQLSLNPGEEEDYEAVIASHRGLSETSPWIDKAIRWGWRTKLSLSCGLDVRMRLKEKAEEGALRVFAENLRDVLLAAPAGERATLGLDPGYRNGVKCAVVDATGKVMDTTIVYPHQPQKRWDAAREKLAELCATYRVELIAVGNGTASRESEKLAREVADLVARAGGTRPTPVTVSEAGASVYSASALAAEEFPNMDVSLRGAVSIARRLQDPLAELVKIDPKSIGVGQYQHDVNQSHLARALDAVVEDAVNGVGVDLNTASVPLLQRVAGVSPTLAANIVAYRDDNGSFATRKELKKVPRLGPKAFEQAAGFLRIHGGQDPLDASAVHPEAYSVVNDISKATGLGVGELIGNSRVLNEVHPQRFATEAFGVPTVTDIVTELEKPGRDPRPEFKTAAFKEGVAEISDLRPGMILEGAVTNVAAFGAFVDVGVHQDGLVHVSAMSHDFVSDPRSIVRSGDVVKVKVVDVDTKRKRISLTLRLDDELGGNRESSASGPRKQSRKSPKPHGQRSGQKNRGKRAKSSDGEAVGTMAEALRQAGFGK